jgi:hypothetical protein
MVQEIIFFWNLMLYVSYKIGDEGIAAFKIRQIVRDTLDKQS